MTPNLAASTSNQGSPTRWPLDPPAEGSPAWPPASDQPVSAGQVAVAKGRAEGLVGVMVVLVPTVAKPLHAGKRGLAVGLGERAHAVGFGAVVGIQGARIVSVPPPRAPPIAACVRGSVRCRRRRSSDP